MESTLRRTWAEIDLDALAHNYETLRRRIGAGVKFLGVVKADAYGHGAVRVAQTLQELGADYLAVSSADEAMELRENGITMPVLILGGIYSGAMTPTEAAAVAVIYALPVGFFVYRGLNLRNAFDCTKDSAVSVGSIMIMIFCSMMLSQTYVVLQIPQAIVESVFSITDNSFLILLLINLILLFVGMIVNDTTGIILVAPLLLPLAKAIGLDPIQYAAIFGVNLAVGSLTPPYASLLYLGIRIGKVDFVEILPYVGLFLLGYVPVMLLTTYWPDVSLFIPRLFGFI